VTSSATRIGTEVPSSTENDWTVPPMATARFMGEIAIVTSCVVSPTA
jgi:hypothetical protein